jgi:NAD-dependent deacetylase
MDLVVTPKTIASLHEGARLLVLTGAGVSAESGVPTFRGMGGIWERYPVEELASPQGFRRDPELVWRFYSERRRHAKACAPNPGHAALAAIEQRLGDRFLLATQNVDGLHGRAGSSRMVELHGGLFRSKCSGCDREPFLDEALHLDALPRCDRCQGLLRPDIVWFGEMLDPRHLERVEAFVAGPGPLVFLAVGTSGAVWPAAGFVEMARQRGAETWLVNLGEADNASAFDYVIDAPSGEVLPSLLEVTSSR